MFESTEKRAGKVFLIPLLLVIWILLHPVSSFSEKSSSKFGHIETPPMPGEASRGSGQKSEDTESLPPAVRELDQKIKRETEVLRRGLTRNVPAPEPESEDESDPAVNRESASSDRSRSVETAKGSAPSGRTPASRKKASGGTASVGVRKQTRPSTPAPAAATEKPAGTSEKKALASRKISQDPLPQNTRVSKVDTSVASKTGTKAPTKIEYTGRTAGGKVHDLTFFLKRLIFFVIIIAVGFLLMRKYVFKT